MTAKDAKQQTIFVNQRKQEFEKKMKPYFDNIRISIEKGEYHYEFNTIPEDVYYHTVSWN